MTETTSPQAMTVHAVVVNYNAGDWLVRSVDALRNGEQVPRITVFDNGSRDDSLASLAALEESGALEITRSEENLGFATACNRALQDSDADAFLVVNPDCEVRADTLRQMTETLAAHPDAGVVGALILDPDGREQRACRRRRPTPWRSAITLLGLEHLGAKGVNIRTPILPSVTEIDAVSGALLLLRARCFRDIDGFDEAYFLHCEDLDLFERMRRAGHLVLLDPAARAIHAKGISQLSAPVRSEWHKHKGMVRYFNAHLREGSSAAVAWIWPMVIWIRFVLFLPLFVIRRWAR